MAICIRDSSGKIPHSSEGTAFIGSKEIKYPSEELHMVIRVKGGVSDKVSSKTEEVPEEISKISGLHMVIRLKGGDQTTVDPLKVSYYSNPYVHASGHADHHIRIRDLVRRVKDVPQFDATHLRYSLSPLIDRCDSCAGKIFEYRLQRVNYTNLAARMLYTPPPGEGAVFYIADSTIHQKESLVRTLTLKSYNQEAAIRKVSGGRSPGLGLHFKVSINTSSSAAAVVDFFKKILPNSIDCGSNFYVTGADKEILFRILDDQNVFPPSARPVFDAICRDSWSDAKIKCHELEYEPLSTFTDHIDTVSYPGISGEYSKVTKSHDCIGILDHSIIFTDPSAVGPLQKLKFLFDNDGSIRLMVNTETKSHAVFKKYLLPFGVDISENIPDTFFCVTGQEVRRTWEALKRHNIFHEKTAKYIDSVLEKGSWKKVS